MFYEIYTLHRKSIRQEINTNYTHNFCILTSQVTVYKIETNETITENMNKSREKPIQSNDISIHIN